MENNNNQQPQPSSYFPQPSFQHLIQQDQQKIQMFLAHQSREIEQINDFKNHQLPLARIKKIMKADEDVRMISAEAPILFSKACELFILELTIRSWLHAEENKRRTLQKNDISAAITRTDIFDFLIDVVPRDEEGGVNNGQPQQPALPGIDEGVYGVHPPSQAWQSVWQSGDGSFDTRGADHGNFDRLGYIDRNPSDSL